MKRTLMYLTVAAFFAATSSAHASTLDFEDLSTPASYDVMPDPYNGFTFTGWYFGVDTVYTPASGTMSCAASTVGDPIGPTMANTLSRSIIFCVASTARLGS